MLYAVRDGSKVTATPRAQGQCPSCRAQLKARCGSINTWHWAHPSRDCDPWHEPETEWHLAWKARAKSEACEVAMGPHRADIRAGATVIELQHSSISVDEIKEREAFYGKMWWIFDGSVFLKNLSLRFKEDYVTFRWRHPRKSLLQARRPFFVDLGTGFTLRIDWLGRECPLGGKGKLFPTEHVAAGLLDEAATSATIRAADRWPQDATARVARLVEQKQRAALNRLGGGTREPWDNFPGQAMLEIARAIK